MRRPASSGNSRRSTTLAPSIRIGALAVALTWLLAAPAASLGELNALGERNLGIARRVLETGGGKIGDFYAACMDEAAVRREGAAALQPLVSRIDDTRDRESLSVALAALDNAGVNAFWLATVVVDAHDSPHHVAVIAPNGNAAGYHMISREQLAALAPQIDWDAYFRGRGFPAFAEINVTDSASLRVLSEGLRDMPLVELKRALRERLLDAFSAWLPPEAGGRSSPLPRWKRCVALVDEEMPNALGRAWIARAFSAQAKLEAEQMVDGIVAAMRAKLAGATWLSEGARAEALAKLDAMTAVVGYPDRWPDFDEGVQVDRQSLLSDILHARAARIAAEVAKLGSPVDRRGFGLSVLTANAYYAPLRNEIVVPAGLLQAPLFGADAASDYGAAGAAIGHEIAHAFDERGRHFGATGAMRDWWTPQDARAFASRAACMANDEDVADATGVALALGAFKATPAGADAQARRRFYDAFRAMWAGTPRAEAALASRCAVW